MLHQVSFVRDLASSATIEPTDKAGWSCILLAAYQVSDGKPLQTLLLAPDSVGRSVTGWPKQKPQVPVEFGCKSRSDLSYPRNSSFVWPRSCWSSEEWKWEWKPVIARWGKLGVNSRQASLSSSGWLPSWQKSSLAARQSVEPHGFTPSKNLALFWKIHSIPGFNGQLTENLTFIKI